jgi:hypothetical protein
VSYAALLSLLAALAFALPFLVRLAEHAGVPRSYGIAVTLAVLIFLSVYAWLYWRLRDDEAGGEALPSEPYVPGVFFQDGVFRGELLLAEGKTEEALAVYRDYQAILERQGRGNGVGIPERPEEDRRASV